MSERFIPILPIGDWWWKHRYKKLYLIPDWLSGIFLSLWPIRSIHGLPFVQSSDTFHIVKCCINVCCPMITVLPSAKTIPATDNLDVCSQAQPKHITPFHESNLNGKARMAYSPWPNLVPLFSKTLTPPCPRRPGRLNNRMFFRFQLHSLHYSLHRPSCMRPHFLCNARQRSRKAPFVCKKEGTFVRACPKCDRYPFAERKAFKTSVKSGCWCIHPRSWRWGGRWTCPLSPWILRISYA